MSISRGNNITSVGRAFLVPANSTHRQYEALRAYFVDKRPSAEVADQFGYSPGSFRVMCHAFRKDPTRPFFLRPAKGPHVAPKRDMVRQRVIALRKDNFSIYDIHRCLSEAKISISPASIANVLKEEGFARLPRRGDEERVGLLRPEKADAADVRCLDLEPRVVSSKFGGLFLFLPHLLQIPLDRILSSADFPGSKKVPAPHAVRSLLALKLFGNARHSHVMSYVFDEGLAWFAGLNRIPKRSLLTEYSCRIDPGSYPKVMNSWFDAVGRLGLSRGLSFDLDFHTIPFHGEDALMEKHYVSKRSRRQKGVLAFLARDAETRVFCYANATVRKEEQNDEVLKFVRFWKNRTGRLPAELIFDSKLTTYANLGKLALMQIDFITLRRRSPKLLEQLFEAPLSKWRRIELENTARAYRYPRILEQTVTLQGCETPLRQIAVRDLGHDDPTVLLTNQINRSAAKLVGRYAQRMIIENAIADGIDFFHMDALGSAVAMKVDCDLQLTLMASSLYRLLGTQLGGAYTTATSRRIFKDFIDAAARLELTDRELVVHFQKRAHAPFLRVAGFEERTWPIPWLGHRRLRFLLG